MRHFALFTLICFSCLTLTPIITAATTQDRHFVKNYLIDYGYLELEHTRQAFKRSLRQFQQTCQQHHQRNGGIPKDSVRAKAS